MERNEIPNINQLQAQFDDVHRRLEVLTENFMRLPSQMSAEEKAELDALEHEHGRLFREIAAAADSIEYEDLDTIYERQKNIRFEEGKTAQDIPLLKAYQEQHGILVRISPSTLKRLQDKAAGTGHDYQSLIDEALKKYLEAP